ncbi:MAG: YafY family protein [Rhodoferax sp.]|nr:YafY family protein [Rhodoferax sp.]
MRRADRLFQIVQLIRGRRLTTAAHLAQRREVSERTVYRDVADLQYQGVPIEGEAGVGYRLGAGFELPPLMGLAPAVQITLQTLREAVQARRKLRVDYRDASEQLTQRTLRPLGCFYWGKVWTLAAWCESRCDFRSFRLDRIDSVRLAEGAGAQFRDEPGKTLADYLRAVAPPQVQAKWIN